MTAALVDVRGNLERVRERIEAAARRAGRSASEIALIGASKTQPPELLAQAVQAGLTTLGENRVQEAAAKIPRVAELTGGAPVEWHLIGSLQTNKVNAALSLFQLIESVDSLRLAESLSRRLAGRSLPVLLEVYLGEEAARPGFRPADLGSALERIRALPGLDVRGLMTVAPLGWDAAATRGAFRQLRRLRDDLRVDQLSMGMTEDYELAIEEGSTMVRIGRALFGPREGG